ncbi:hypothetical protein H696_03548 [Fonticula alba]|uniref:DUF4187 domain-containing protein n=1 Tax=Fonticula alba TaxID=691883 RepID=A0A058Z7K6_FONAL|nr:hypothetical protein H696_03548 [Fonticula alba]KCV70086.1 hypothetical protein H696_03548 [Fonticula alba]|eukprot:XP_009495692.1 hypothetical protein H696_03548 [Fonticula alba]
MFDSSPPSSPGQENTWPPPPAEYPALPPSALGGATAMDPSAERDSSSEEELDYMSDAVLQAAEDALQKSRSLTGRRPAKMVTKKRGPARTLPLAERAMDALRDGMQKPLQSDNKGFRLLYGETAPKPGGDSIFSGVVGAPPGGASSSAIPPAPIQVDLDRFELGHRLGLGFGMDELAAPFVADAAADSSMPAEPAHYAERVFQARSSRQDANDERAARKLCFRLDLKQNIPPSCLWPILWAKRFTSVQEIPTPPDTCLHCDVASGPGSPAPGEVAPPTEANGRASPRDSEGEADAPSEIGEPAALSKADMLATAPEVATVATAQGGTASDMPEASMGAAPSEPLPGDPPTATGPPCRIGVSGCSVFEALEVADRLSEVNEHLRRRHTFCIWCMDHFEPADSPGGSSRSQCPGPTRDLHFQ